MEGFFSISNKNELKLDSFLQIPKILFTDERYKRLTVPAKIAYCLYKQRDSITKFRDKDSRKYIVYKDEEIRKLLDVSKRTMTNIKNSLEEAGLIECRIYYGVNRIYVSSFMKDNPEYDGTFYYQDEIERYTYYQFPNVFFEERFSSLPLQAKLIYTIYYDMMRSSQFNYFTDNRERIYFVESILDQETKICLTTKTIKKYKDYLYAGHLLFSVNTGTEMRYYLLKLNMFHDVMLEYESYDQQTRKEYIRKLRNELKEAFLKSEAEKEDEIDFIKECMKAEKITQKAMIELLSQRTGKSISLSGFKKYLNRTRNMPQWMAEFYIEYFQKMGYEKNSSGFESQNEEAGAEIQMSGKTSDETLSDRINTIQEYIQNSIILTETDKHFLGDSFKRAGERKSFIIKRSHKILKEDEMVSLIELIGDEYQFEDIVTDILNRMKTGNTSFSSPDAQIQYFLTAFFTRLMDQGSEPEWFIKEKEYSTAVYRKREYPELYKRKSVSDASDVPEEIKDYNWWEN